MSAMGKADVQISSTKGCNVPTTDTDGLNASDNLRPKAAVENKLFNLYPCHIADLPTTIYGRRLDAEIGPLGSVDMGQFVFDYSPNHIVIY